MTMNQEMVDILAGLKTQWGILKDDKKLSPVRTKACERICELTLQAKTIDPKFEVIDMNNTKYAEFLPKKYVAKSDVNWTVFNDRDFEDGKIASANDILDMCEGLAVRKAKARLPNERVDSQKFGMIVGHYTKILVDLYLGSS